MSPGRQNHRKRREVPLGHRALCTCSFFPAPMCVLRVREPGNTCTLQSPPYSSGSSAGSMVSRKRFFHAFSLLMISIFFCVRSSRKGWMSAHATEKIMGTLMRNMRPSVSG